MSHITIEVPMTGTVEGVRVANNKQVRTPGVNRPASAAELVALVGLPLPENEDFIFEVVQRNPAKSCCTLKVSTRDENKWWLEALEMKVSAIGNPESLRSEIEKMEEVRHSRKQGEDDIEIVYNPAGKAKKKNRLKFPKLKIKAGAEKELKSLEKTTPEPKKE
jgi:hypothetical protein